MILAVYLVIALVVFAWATATIGPWDKHPVRDALVIALTWPLLALAIIAAFVIDYAMPRQR